MSYPLISVYMPTHNRAHVIERAIKSVISQDYPNWELVIVDDGGTDNTSDLMQPYLEKYSNIHFIRHDTAQGACVARNTAINFAKGEFVSGLDDDDEFLPNRLSTLYHAYSSDYSFVCSAWHIRPRTLRNTLRDWFRYKSGVFSLEQLLSINQVGNQIFTLRSRLLDLDGFDENLTAWQDYDMWVRLVIKYGDFKKINNKTQVIYEDDFIGNRVTTSSKKNIGIEFFLKKYSKYMTNAQYDRICRFLK